MVAIYYTVNGAIFAELNIHGFSPMRFFTGILHSTLASCVYYLTTAKYSWENFHGTLKNHDKHKRLAQRILPC